MTNSSWARPQIYITYETPEPADGWDRDHAEAVPAIGQGVIDERGRRWRVVDVWHSMEKRAPIDFGIHVFLRPVSPEDDRPAHLHPDYYTP